MRSISLLVVGGLIALTSSASAHIKLTYPPARPGGINDVKDAPCGIAGSKRVASPTVLASGQKLIVTWDETVGHDGFFIVSFDDDGADFPIPLSQTAVDNDKTFKLATVPDPSNNPLKQFQVEVPLPDIECDNCTIQLIQVMSTAKTWSEPDLYFHCSDVTLRRGATPDPPPGGRDGGPGGGGNPDAGTADPTAEPGGCTTGGAPGILMLLSLVGLMKRSRR